MRKLASVLVTVLVVGALTAGCDNAPTSSVQAEAAADGSPGQASHISGEFSVTWDATNRSRGDVDLDAHEGDASSEDRGTFEWEAYDENGNLVREMTITATDVDVTGNVAKWVAQVTFDSWGSLTGYWYAFYAEDHGSPGPGNDKIQWAKSSTKSGLPGGGTLSYTSSDLPDRFTVSDGNLTVNGPPTGSPNPVGIGDG